MNCYLPWVRERMGRTRFSGNRKRGQSLIEVLVAVFIGILLFVAAASIIAPVLRSNTEVARMQTASSLAKQLMEHVVVFAGSDWHNIDGSPGFPLAISDPASGVYHYYHLSTTTSPFEIRSGEENLEVGTTTYKRYFYVENVYRKSSQDNNGEIDTRDNPIIYGSVVDPSTKKVTVLYSWMGGTPRSFSRYITRTRNNVLIQTDWSGGPGQPLTTTSTIRNEFFSHNNIEFASSVGSLVLAGVGVSPPPPQPFTLTVGSNSFSPAHISVTQDKNGQVEGWAPPDFTLIYDEGTDVTLTAQAYPQTNLVFQSWQKNGVVVSTSPTITIAMTANTTMKAMYGSVFVLTVNSANYGASVLVTPQDKSIPPQGDGLVPFTRRYTSGTNVTLTAQAPTGFVFLRWTKNGVVVYTNPMTFAMTEDTTVYAVFRESLQELE